jgi:hypothetical protein
MVSLQSFIAPNLICWFKQQGLEKEDVSILKFEQIISLCQKLFQQLAQGASQVPQFTSPPWF